KSIFNDENVIPVRWRYLEGNLAHAEAPMLPKLVFVCSDKKCRGSTGLRIQKVIHIRLLSVDCFMSSTLPVAARRRPPAAAESAIPDGNPFAYDGRRDMLCLFRRLSRVVPPVETTIIRWTEDPGMRCCWRWRALSVSPGRHTRFSAGSAGPRCGSRRLIG